MRCGPPGGVRRPARASADAPPDARLVCTAGARLVCTATHQHKYAPSPTLPPHPDTQHPGAHTRHTGTDAAHGPAPLHANNPQTSSPTRLSTHTHTHSHPHTHTPTQPHNHSTAPQTHKLWSAPLSLCVVQSTLTPFISVTLCFDVFGVIFLPHTPHHTFCTNLSAPSRGPARAPARNRRRERHVAASSGLGGRRIGHSGAHILLLHFGNRDGNRAARTHNSQLRSPHLH